MSDKTWLDVTYLVQPEMVVWPGQPQVERRRVSSIDEGKDSNVSISMMSMHTGTHMDAPLHLYKVGRTLPLRLLKRCSARSE